MLRTLFSDRKVLVLAAIALLIRLFSANASWVERWYSLGFYPPFSRGLRWLLGWVPVSLGDLLYAAAGVFLIWKAARFVRRWRSGRPRKALLARLLHRLVLLALGVYVVFQLFWGLNYSRQGIAHQLGLDEQPVPRAELVLLAHNLLGRLRQTAPLIDTVHRRQLDDFSALQKESLAAYALASRHLPFLQYRQTSLKPSLFSAVGHYFGFTGYYNPFTGEGQLKTSIPVFSKPFVLTHEMGHQLGYGKESEANFVSFLTCRHARNPEMRYSVYFEMYLYTLSALRRTDSVMARRFREAAPPLVQRDLRELADYLDRSRNPVEPYISVIYDAYLRRNNQPKGTLSYNEVVVWLAAYRRKFGMAAL